MKRTTIFISYSWQTKEIADKISSDLQLIGVTIIKDNQELNYTDNIPNFMKRIRSCDYALLLISESYLKSKNCLFEILELQKDENCWDKILPIIEKETKFYTAIERLKYVRYWEQKTQELEKELENVNPINSSETYKELKLFRDITVNIDKFLIRISESLHFSSEEIIKKNYEPLIEKFSSRFDSKSLINLINIALIKNLEKREVALEEYAKNYGENSYYFSIKGGTSRDLKKYDQAIHYFNKGLKLDSKNYEILNNLGQILEFVKNDYKQARICYEKAIESKPEIDIPRLNLGVLLNRHFNDPKGAKEQYEKILEFDPNNAKAHNNLSNYYKVDNPTDEQLKKAEFHMLKAIESNPLYIDALFNYGNFLKVYRKEIDKGNEYYKKVRELDKEGNFKEILDVLMKSKKG